MAPRGTTMLPVANGQRPATARKNVDFPPPEGPVTSACWPASMTMSSLATSGAPEGSRTDSPSIVRPVLVSCAVTSTRGDVAVAARATAIE